MGEEGTGAARVSRGTGVSGMAAMGAGLRKPLSKALEGEVGSSPSASPYPFAGACVGHELSQAVPAPQCFEHCQDKMRFVPSPPCRVAAV